MPLPDADWLGLCRRAAHAAREAVAGLTSTAERAVQFGEGEGGDTTLAVDRVAEDAVFDALASFGAPLLVVSEERGEVSLNGGIEGDGFVRLVVDPVDGSMNAKRGLPFACVSIAVASGARMADVQVGFVAELDPPRDWWAVRGEGAFLGDRRLGPLEPGPLIVEEAGGAVALPGGDALDLSLRTRAAAARSVSMLERLRTTLL